MIGGLFKGRQHEHAVLHLGYTKTCDAKDFALRRELEPAVYFVEQTSLICHDISEKHNVARVYAHSVRGHGMLDLIDNGSSSRFDTQDLTHFHDVIRRRIFAHDA